MNYLDPFWRLHNKLPCNIVFYVTARCNARCPHCFYATNIPQDELTLEEIEEISTNMWKVPAMSFTGGEPFLRQDLQKIVRTFCENNGVRYVHIPTNGILSSAIKRAIADLLSDCENTFFKVSLSLDGIGKDHDAIRGVKGCFERVLKTCSMLNELKERFHNLSINIITTISNLNQFKVLDVIDFVEEKLDSDSHNVNYLRGMARDQDVRKPSIRQYEAAVNRLKIVSKKKTSLFSTILDSVISLTRDVVLQTLKEDRIIYPCVAGRKMLVISEIGDVFPCELLDMKLGNLRNADYDLKRIISSEEARKINDYIKKIRCFCTFECAIQNNILCNIRAYPALLKRWIGRKTCSSRLQAAVSSD